MRRRIGMVLYLALMFSIIAIAPAHAYIDPGSGSLIIQVLVGAAVASALTIRLAWRRVRDFFSGLFSRET